MRKILFLFLISITNWNCFTYSVLAKHHTSLRDQKDSLPYLKKSILNVNVIRRSSKELLFLYSSGLYNEQDTKYRYIDPEFGCIKIESMRPSFYAYQDFKYLDPCNGEALEFSEQLTIEEIPELKNGIWLPGLDLVLHSKNGFDPLLNPFPSPHQLEKQIFRPKTRTYITVNAKEFLKGHEIISAELCFGSYFSHRYLKIQASGGEVINLSSAGGPFEIFMTDSGRPSSIPKNISLNKCEILGISKFSLPKGERILAFQSEYSSGISKIWKTESRVFRLKGHIEDLPDGILFIARPDDLRKKDDRLSVWSAYPILYPFSIGLDIVTSPLQLISIIVFGYENHLYLWGCLLAGKCRIPLG